VRSRDHCCRVQTQILNSMSLSVILPQLLDRQTTTFMYPPYCRLWLLFPTLYHKRSDFLAIHIEYKMCFFSTTFAWNISHSKNNSAGTAAAQWLRCCATNRKVAGSIQLVSLEFFIDIKSFRSHYGPGVDSASNRNEYQEYLLGGEGVRLTTLPPSSTVLTKSGNLNFLEPSGPLQTCKGTLKRIIQPDMIINLHVKYTFSCQISKKLASSRHAFQILKHKILF